MSEIAVSVKNLSKKFRVFHERRDSIFESITGIINRKKFYEDLDVLDSVTFSVNKGEMFGIVGKNGAGKSTLLKLISGIFEPDKGEIVVNGKIIPLLSLGLGFQVDLTARTNVIQYGLLLGFEKKQILNKIDKIMQFAELEKFADTKLKNFSAGMYARLAFSTAMQVEPDILIIDEALSAGDVSFQQKAFNAINAFKDTGKTVIVVTHDMNPVRQICNRAAFLNNGKIEDIGEPEKVVNSYLNHFNQQ